MIDLLKIDTHLTDNADEWGQFGYLQVRNGKTEYRKESPDYRSGKGDS
jgi:hypothetical protein